MFQNVLAFLKLYGLLDLVVVVEPISGGGQLKEGYDHVTLGAGRGALL